MTKMTLPTEEEAEYSTLPSLKVRYNLSTPSSPSSILLKWWEATPQSQATESEYRIKTCHKLTITETTINTKPLDQESTQIMLVVAEDLGL